MGRRPIPTAASRSILNVPKFDFNWQFNYELAEPLQIPAGSKIIGIGVYDNSPKNRWNPAPHLPSLLVGAELGRDVSGVHRVLGGLAGPDGAEAGRIAAAEVDRICRRSALLAGMSIVGNVLRRKSTRRTVRQLATPLDPPPRDICRQSSPARVRARRSEPVRSARCNLSYVELHRARPASELARIDRSCAAKSFKSRVEPSNAFENGAQSAAARAAGAGSEVRVRCFSQLRCRFERGVRDFASSTSQACRSRQGRSTGAELDRRLAGSNADEASGVRVERAAQR